ncbi:MAG: TolC family protein, partial [Elusimicrobia bacterium]|nr:TolC family protein [Elusimicrobiota bacterium]
MSGKGLLLLAVLALAGGCTMAPKYAKPQAPVAAGWPTGPAYDGVQTSTGAPAAADLQWREFFVDEKLRLAIEAALRNNRDLRLAALNVDLARALYGIKRAELWPAVDAVGSGLKQRVPGDLSSTGQARTSEQYGVNLGVAAWEIDFFGRVRSLKQSALEQYLATEQGRRSAQILLVSSVATAYLSLAAYQENLALAERTLASQQAAYDLIKRRHALGLVTDVDLYRAQTPVDIARRDAALLTQTVAQGRNALDLLLGVPTPDALLPSDLDSVAPPTEISAGLSSAVLLRRPDVLRAEGLL